MVLGDFVAYRLKFQPGYIAFKTCVERGEPLSSPVEQKVTPQKSDSYISFKLQLNASTRWQITLPVLTMVTSHGHRLFHEG
jgi:hypothetical protein